MNFYTLVGEDDISSLCALKGLMCAYQEIFYDIRRVHVPK